MFSRTAKSVVKSLTSCQIHSDGKNFKLPESLTTKSCSAEVNQPNARKINDNINLNLSNHQEDNGRSQTEKLVEALYRLPIAEEVSALNSPLMPSEKIISKRELQTKQESLTGKLRECGTIKHATNFHRCDDHHFEESKLLYSDRLGNDDYFPQGEEYEDEIGTDDHQLGEKKTLSKKSSHFNDEYDNFDSAVSGKELRLGEPDCGEDSPSQPKRNPCGPPEGPCQPAEPPGYPSKPKSKRKPFCAVKKLKLKQVEAFLKRLLRPSIGMLEKYFDSRTQCGLKSILETQRLEFNRWNHKFSMKVSNSTLVCTRNFSTCMNKPKNIFIMRKALNRLSKESKRYVSKHSIMTEYNQVFLKKPPTARPLSMVAFSPSCLSSFKSVPPIEKYIIPSLSCYQESINFKCRNMLSSPYSPPCPTARPKPIKNLPSLKIYNKCPSLLKNLNFLKLQKNKEILTYRGPSYLVSLHRLHRRGFHITSFCLTDSSSGKSSTCKKMEEICKLTEVKKTKESDRTCDKKKDDICSQKKVKCQEPKETKAEVKSKSKTEQKIVDPVCKKTCLATGKCEWPHTVPPPKMQYIKVTCPPPKFMKPEPCPSISKHFQNKDDELHTKVKRTNLQKNKVCASPPLPKPPFPPMALCPCPPPRKIHPGSCPCYEKKEAPKPSLMKPCPSKKKYPCPTSTHICSMQKKPCNSLKQLNNCEQKKKKKTPL
ncbi:uncharacterized protein [Anoplolepis gracilipes]|uniref:uncharacterized protein n=1 Tax=Anoplolepis gracilipes TaxID=354296 RepID=UPI003B9DC8B3